MRKSFVQRPAPDGRPQGRERERERGDLLQPSRSLASHGFHTAQQQKQFEPRSTLLLISSRVFGARTIARGMELQVRCSQLRSRSSAHASSSTALLSDQLQRRPKKET